MAKQKMDAGTIIRRSEKAFNGQERTNADAEWGLLAEFMMTNQSGIFQGSTASAKDPGSGSSTLGGKKTHRIFDSTAIQANHDLAAAIHATLTNPSSQWSKIRYKDEDLNNDDEAVSWIEDTNRRIHSALNESNFDTQISRAYQSLPALGTMLLLHDQKEISDNGFEGFKFQALHLAEIAFTENADGVVDVLYRRFRLTARQAIELFGDEVSETIKRTMEEEPEKEFGFLHAIFPRAAKDVEINEVGLARPNKRPYVSMYIEQKEKKIVKEGGYYEFPIYAVRWQTMPSEVYGRGPGHIALPDVRTLNKVKELGLHAINKAINPPILATQRGIFGSLDLRPGGVTVVRDVNGVREMPPQARFDVTQFAVEDLKNAIKSIFFIDKLVLPARTETGEMTAFEVAQRVDQMQKVLGPTLSRLNSELLTPLISRCFTMLLRGGALAPMPPILQERGVDVEIVFVNQLARSQQIQDVSSIQDWAQALALLAQFKPEIVDNMDADGIARHTAKVLGVPEEAVADEDDVEATRQQRAQAQQQQMALDQAVQAADVAAKSGGANGTGGAG